MLKLIFSLALITGTVYNAISQQNPVWFVAQVADDNEIGHIYDSLGQPLLVVNSNVYSISSDCITRALDAAANDRGLGGAANRRNNGAAANNRNNTGGKNDRNNTGTANDRANTADANDRFTGGGAGDRAEGGGRNNRNNSGNANDRANAADANDRNNSAGVLSFYCAIDKKGKLLLYFKNTNRKDHVRIYYGHSFFNSKYFKIIPL